MLKYSSSICLFLALILGAGSGALPKQKIDLWRKTTQLRGVNILQSFVSELDLGTKGRGPLGSPFTLSDFKEIAALGANYVNISHPGPYTEKPPFRLDERVFENLDRLLKMIQDADMFAVISIRTGPGRNEFTFVFGEDKSTDPVNGWFPATFYNDSVWTDQAARNAWAEMWTAIAKRYKDNAIVVGYDLMVEPNANEIFFKTYDGGTFYKRHRNTGYDWNNWYPTLVEAIRKVDSKTPILLQPMGHAHVDWIPFLKASSDPNIVYALHHYEPFSYTHQDGAVIRYPESFNSATLKTLLSPADHFLQAVKGAAVVNEFGLHRNVPGAGPYLSDMMDLFEERGWNYALWVWYSAHFVRYRPANETDFDLRFGSNLKNTVAISNPFRDAILKHWKLNRIRPSNTKF